MDHSKFHLPNQIYFGYEAGRWAFEETYKHNDFRDIRVLSSTEACLGPLTKIPEEEEEC